MGSCLTVEAARPPPEICGIWSTGPLAIKKHFAAAYEGRVAMGLPEAENDDAAYAILIVDDKGQCQYRKQGKAVGGSYVSASAATTYSGPILDFGLDGENWVGRLGVKFSMPGKAYVDSDGEHLLTTIAFDGNKMNRLASLTLGPPINKSVLMTCGEAEDVGVAPILYAAIKAETKRIQEMQAKDQPLSVSALEKEDAAPGSEGEAKLNGATIVRASSRALEAEA